MADDGTTTTDGGEGGEGGTTDPPATDKTFTQSDVDRIVQERLARAKTAPPPDYDDLKAKAAKLEELEAANQTELEKAIARAEAAEKNAETATTRARQSDIRSAVTAEATKAGAVDVDAVLALLAQDAVTVGDDGQVTGAEDAVKALLESKPYLVGQAAPPPPTGSADGGARGSGNADGQLSRDDLKNMTPQEIVKAKAEGLLDSVLGGSA